MRARRAAPSDSKPDAACHRAPSLPCFLFVLSKLISFEDGLPDWDRRLAAIFRVSIMRGFPDRYRRKLERRISGPETTRSQGQSPASFVNQALKPAERQMVNGSSPGQLDSSQNEALALLPGTPGYGSGGDAADLSNPERGRLNRLSSRRLHSAALAQSEVQRL